MKFTERSNGLYLEDITSRDVRFANLAGRMTGSIYDDPQRPQHVYVVWIDEDLVDIFKGLGIKVKEKEDEETGKLSYSVQFKAYPKMRLNRKNGKEEQTPKVMLRTTENTVRLEAGSFGVADAAHVGSVDIRFHPWQWDERRPDCVAVIDELWITVDEGAGEADESYLDEKYGYEDEPLPFS